MLGCPFLLVSQFGKTKVPLEGQDLVSSYQKRRHREWFRGPITWSSKIQRSVTTSTTEAEYHTLAHAAKEAVWLQNLLSQLKIQVDKSITLYGDNKGSIAPVQNPLFHARTKHIDVSTHYTRELHEQDSNNAVFTTQQPTSAALGGGWTSFATCLVPTCVLTHKRC